ncbi:MAG: hypothetical protein WKF57_14655 [Nakamurella sp.]
MTTPGTVIDNVEIRGRLIIQAANVTVNNSLITGPEDPASAGRGGIVQNTGGFANLVIKNSTVKESHQSVNNTEGVVGSNFTLENSTVEGSIDNVQIRGSNVTLRNNTLKNTVKYASDSAQGGGPSHSDNVQVLRGDNILIEGNTITGSQNFAVLGSSEQGSMMNLRVLNNSVDGGSWTMKFSNKTLTGSINPQSIVLAGNHFGGHSAEGVDLIVARGVNFSDQGGNVRDDTGKAVQISWVPSGG